MVARLAGASQVRLVLPGYATIEIDLKHEKAAGDRESVQAAERSYIERTAPKKKVGSMHGQGSGVPDHSWVRCKRTTLGS